MRIGLIVAIEMDAIFDYYGECEELNAPKGYRLYKTDKEKYELYILHAGMGEIFASAGVQYLVTACGVEIVFNYGVVGGLTQEMSRQKVCIVESVVHYKYDLSEWLTDMKVGQVDAHDSVYLPASAELIERALKIDPTLKKVICCSGDKFVGTAEEKNYLHEAFGGDICDMESAGIVLACEMNGVPCVLLKAVSDGLADGAEGFVKELYNTSLLCLETSARIMDEMAVRI